MKKTSFPVAMCCCLLFPVSMAAAEDSDQVLMDCWLTPTDCAASVDKFITDWDSGEVGLENEMGVFAVKLVDQLNEAPSKSAKERRVRGFERALARIANWFMRRGMDKQAEQITTLMEDVARRRGQVPSAN